MPNQLDHRFRWINPDFLPNFHSEFVMEACGFRESVGRNNLRKK